MAYMMEDRLKDAMKETNKERALKDVAEATVKEKEKEKDKAMENADERTRAAERAQTLAKQKVVETEVKLGGTELKHAEAESLNSANVKEISELRMSLEASEYKWYIVGFVDAENLVEPRIRSSRSFTNLGGTSSVKDEWQHCRLWECLKTLLLETPIKSLIWILLPLFKTLQVLKKKKIPQA